MRRHFAAVTVYLIRIYTGLLYKVIQQNSCPGASLAVDINCFFTCDIGNTFYFSGVSGFNYQALGPSYAFDKNRIAGFEITAEKILVITPSAAFSR